MEVQKKPDLDSRQGRVRVASLVLVAVLVMVLAIGWPTWARKQAQSLPFEEVATTWVGLSTDEHYLVRLVLEGDRTGRGGYTFLDEEPRTFRILEWTYESGRVQIVPVPPEGPPTWVSPMRGKVLGTTLHLHASGDDWEVRIVLRREPELEKRWRRLKQAM